MGSGALCFGLVVGVQQLALVDREAAAADAGGQALAQGLQGLDACVEVVTPAARQALPVAPARRSARRQARECGADLDERDAGGSACLDERDPAKNGSVVAALVAVRPGRGDQAATLVEAQRRGRDPASPGDVSDL